MWADVRNGRVVKVHKRPEHLIDPHPDAKIKTYTKKYTSDRANTDRLKTLGRYVVRSVRQAPGPGQIPVDEVIAYDAATDTVTRTVVFGDPDLDALKERRTDEVDALRDAKLDAGFVYATLSATFDADAEAQDNITAIAAGIGAGKGLPGGLTTIGWWDKANVTHTLTEVQFLDFAAAHRDFVALIKQTGRGHKNAIVALATVAEVSTYDIAAGW